MMNEQEFRDAYATLYREVRRDVPVETLAARNVELATRLIRAVIADERAKQAAPPEPADVPKCEHRPELLMRTASLIMEAFGYPGESADEAWLTIRRRVNRLLCRMANRLNEMDSPSAPQPAGDVPEWFVKLWNMRLGTTVYEAWPKLESEIARRVEAKDERIAEIVRVAEDDDDRAACVIAELEQQLAAAKAEVERLSRPVADSELVYHTRSIQVNSYGDYFRGVSLKDAREFVQRERNAREIADQRATQAERERDELRAAWKWTRKVEYEVRIRDGKAVSELGNFSCYEDAALAAYRKANAGKDESK